MNYYNCSDEELQVETYDGDDDYGVMHCEVETKAQGANEQQVHACGMDKQRIKLRFYFGS